MPGLKPKQAFAPPNFRSDPGQDGSFMDDPEQDGSYLDPRLAAMADTSGYESSGDNMGAEFAGTVDPSRNNQPLVQAPPVMSPSPAAVSGRPPDPFAGTRADLAASHTNLAGVIAAKPDMPQPKWWQRILAGAEGGIAGYVNAAGRTRPIDASGAIQNTLQGDQPRKLSNWLNRAQAAEANVQANQANLDTAMRGTQLESQINLQGAQADLAKKRGDALAAGKNRFKFDARSGAAFDTETGQFVQAPKSDIDKMNDRNAYAQQQGWTEQTHPGVTPWIADGKWGLPGTAKTLGQTATQILADNTLTDEQKQARLDQIKNANSALHPEHAVTHFETDENGRVTAVAVKPSDVLDAGGKTSFGIIGKPKGSGGGDQPKPANPAQFRLGSRTRTDVSATRRSNGRRN